MIRMLFVALAFLALSFGCASGYYQTSSTYDPSLFDVPPSFYDNDPALRHWYTGPYWHPETM